MRIFPLGGRVVAVRRPFETSRDAIPFRVYSADCRPDRRVVVDVYIAIWYACAVKREGETMAVTARREAIRIGAGRFSES